MQRMRSNDLASFYSVQDEVVCLLARFLPECFGGHFVEGLQGAGVGAGQIPPGGKTGSGGGFPSPKNDLISFIIRLMWR
jgi:hypothetical protein